jgi:hypothetical protein
MTPRYFEYAHLPAHLQEVSKPFHDLAVSLLTMVPPGEQRDLGMQRLLEAKDCMVRGRIPDTPKVYIHTQPGCPFKFCDQAEPFKACQGHCRHE